MKTAVYFCTCGTNISDRIDAEEVKQALKSAGEDCSFTVGPFLCSEEGQEFLKEDLARVKPERVVIAACSPREHEPTFQGVMAEAGLNPYLFQMVNIREHIAWVTADKEQAVCKTILALKTALKRVVLHQPLERLTLEISPAVLVIGAGPAGLKAATALAEAGREVILVEKSPVIGGLPVLCEDLFPELECGSCLLEPVMGDILHGRHAEKIELLTMAELQEVTGFIGNFTATIRQRPRYVDPHRCIGCGECFEPCPISGPNPFNGGLDDKKAIAFPFFGGLPSVPYIDPDLCLRFTAGSACQLCSDACPMGADIIDHNHQEQIISRQVGAIVLAIGASLYDCSRFANLGYGQLPEVRTALEFERMLAANGPTGGDIVTSTGEQPRSVAFIHCVGSLDDQHQSYCSGICCQLAFKFNHLLAEKLPEAEIHHLFREVVCPGKEGQALYQAARHNPKSFFHRYEQLPDLTVKPGDNGRQMVSMLGKEVITADLVVLCPAVIPAADTLKLGTALDLAFDRFGFFDAEHSRLDPARSKLRGIYLAGACQSPADIRDSVNQGMAASGYILSELVSGQQITLDPLFASVQADKCSGCRICNGVCPYRAISFDAEKGVSEINPHLCRGCGTCAAACPMGAIAANHFSQDMIMAEIAGVLQ